jgi:hypothetical protein
MNVWNIKDPDCPSSAIYIGRAGHGKDGTYGNPFSIGKHGTREEVITQFKRHLWDTPALLRRTIELRGHDLVCFCKPAACHGDIYKACLDALTDQQIMERIKVLEG